MVARDTVRIGVFIPSECQLLDQACIDVFASMSYEYLSRLSDFLPQTIIDVAPSVQIHYIGSVQRDEPIPLTANQRILATDHFSDPEVAPGKLDIVIVPGPFFDSPFTDEAADWLHRQGTCETTDILSVCSGVLLCGKAGLLEGRKACGPRGAQSYLIEHCGKNVEFVGTKLRWVQSGNFWSAGGITNGNDLAAAYCRQSKRFPRPLVEALLGSLDVGDRSQEYEVGQTRFTLYVGVSLFGALLLGYWRKMF